MKDGLLYRFIEAQEDTYHLALDEIKNGKKRSHWMWYIFPQHRRLGISSRSRFYGISDLDEAKAYLEHPVLSGRLYELCSELLKHKDSGQAVLGYEYIRILHVHLFP